MIAAALVVLGPASTHAALTPPVPDRVTAVTAEVESHLAGLEVSVERASYGSARAPHRLLAETRTAVGRLAAARRDLIGQPWQVARPLLRRLDLVERRARTLLAKLESWQPRTAPTVVAAPQGTGMIKGTVRAAATGLPLAGVRVNVLSYYYGTLLATALTDATGAYTATGLGYAQVTVRTTDTAGYVDVAYDGVPCEPNCSAYYGVQLTTQDDATLSGIDFRLVAAATITGRVTSSVDGSPVAGVEVGAGPLGWGSFIAEATTGTDGTYTISELSPGQYQALASHPQWADEAFDDVPCEPLCGPMAGTPLFLSSGQTRGNVDFVLDPTGSISGRAYLTSTGEGAYAEILVYDANGDYVSSATSWSSETGNFAVADLPAGTYFVGAWTWQWKELYRELPWPQPFDPTRGTPVVVAGGDDTPNVEFTNSLGDPSREAISGQVVDALSGLPLQASISVFNASGSLVATDWSSSTGYYLVTGLNPGVYYATADSAQHLPETFDNLPCSASCDPRSGTPVQVFSDVPTEGVDFSLDQGGWIEGRVVGADTGHALSPAQVEVFNSSGTVVSTVSTDDTGHYAAFGLDSGSYFVRATRSSYDPPGYAPQLYSEILCEAGCDIVAGTPVPVTVGLPTSGINFSLTPLGQVTGTVTDTATGAPIAGATVHVQKWGSWYYLHATTDADGHYRVPALPSGSVLVLAQHERFRDELYDNVPCEQGYCETSLGTPVSVAAGTTAEHIDFALRRLGTVTGRVTRADSGQALDNVSVVLYASGGYPQWNSYTDEDGRFEAIGLETGTYFARTANSPQELIDELYKNTPCEPSCTPTSGTPISVLAGEDTTGIDFALETGGTISGFVTDEVTGSPIEGYHVTAYGSTGTSVSSTDTTSTGSYTLRGLVAGTYFVTASRYWYDSPYVGELYQNIQCEPSCNVTTGTPVAVTTGGAVSGIDFGLERMGGISGSVSRASDGGGLRYANVQFFDVAGTYIGGTSANELGKYTFSRLAQGTYYVKASVNGFAAEVYDNVLCDPSCVVTTGSPVTVTAGETTGPIDFSLELRGGITGIVTEDPTGTPIPDTELAVFTATGQWAGDTSSDRDGSYALVGLPAGTYFVRTYSISHYDELYDNLPCETGCTVTAGAPVTVTVGATTSNVNFALLPHGSVGGTVRDNLTGAPLNRQVKLYSAAGNYVASGNTDLRGSYRIVGLAPGTYYAVTGPDYYSSTDEHVDELYNDIPCDAGCTVTSGTPITVVEGTTTTDIDFVLRRNGRITGRVTDATYGLPVLQRYVIVYDASGNAVSYDYTDEAGNFSSPYLPTGSYYIATQNYETPDPWIDQLWEGRECEPSCNPTLGTPVVVAPDTVTTGINIALYKPFFADVPTDHWARSFIHSLYRHGITAGCGADPLIYCPASLVNRAQNAVFLGVAGHGAGFTPPPPTGTVFADVPAGYWAAAWIEQLWTDGLTSGCAADPPRYCPESALTRAEMSVFLLSAKYGPTYQPPPATGTVFADVPIDHWAGAWIEQLAAEGITAGCAPGLFCPDGVVDRAQMAVFLVTTFSMTH